MCIHIDGNHADSAMFHTSHTHTNKNVEKKKEKRFIWQKKLIAKLRPHQMTGASQRASRAVTRERQNSNEQYSAYF